MHQSSSYAQIPYIDPRISLPGFPQYRGLGCGNSDLEEPPTARIAPEMKGEGLERRKSLKTKVNRGRAQSIGEVIAITN